MMHKYEMIVYWSKEDHCFVVEVPELPGCMADGATATEAINNVDIIIEQWIATAKLAQRQIPEPKGRLAYAWMSCEFRAKDRSEV